MTDEEREFIGFFAGEGTMYIQPARMKTINGIRSNYCPILKVELRADDYQVIKWIQDNFGGMVYYKTKYHGPREITNQNGKTYIQNPTAGWKTGSREICLKIVSLLEQTKIPSRKLRQELPIFKRFLEIKQRGHRNGFQGKWFTDDELKEQEKLGLELRSLKIFREV